MSARNTKNSEQKHTSVFSEKTTIAVMARLKGANRCLDNLHEINKMNLNLIEEMIVADFANKSLHLLLLRSLENLNRTKQVLSFKDAKGEMTGLEMRINPTDFRVTLIRGGKAVRVCITPEKAAELKAKYGDRPSFTIYE